MKVRQEVFNTYWKFAAERQNIFFRKLQGKAPPYTKDPILRAYKFCNVYRASDRVSQFLIKSVIYGGGVDKKDTLFRIFLFRLLNRIETWIKLEEILGQVMLKNFNFASYSKALQQISNNGPIYGNAFILCANKAFGFDRKHQNHLALLEKVFVKENIVNRLLSTKSLEDLFYELKKLPLIGDFMAYQIAIDFNYSEVFDFSENDFVVAGPGAVRGIKKCFYNPNSRDFTSIIHWMVENQEQEFKRLGIDFKDLWGRPLHAIDCEGLFCEVDKYSRIKFPKLKSNRVRIKTKYKPSSGKIKYFYPPKWGINNKIAAITAHLKGHRMR